MGWGRYITEKEKWNFNVVVLVTNFRELHFFLDNIVGEIALVEESRGDESGMGTLVVGFAVNVELNLHQ